MRRLRSAIIAVMAVGAAATASAQAPAAPAIPSGAAAPARVLVLPFTVEPDPPASAGPASSAWLGEAAAILVSEEFEALGLETFGRDERVDAFDRLQLPLLAPLTRATTIRAGELVGASDIVVGEVVAGRDGLRARARLIRLDVGQQIAEIEDRDAEIAALFARVAGALARSSGRPLVADPQREPPLPADVLENYVKGLMAVAPETRQRFLEAAFHGARRDGRVLLALWAVYADQGEHAKALAAAKTVSPESPLLRRARFLAALSTIELGRLNEAFSILTELHDDAPAPAISSALGVVQLRRGTVLDGEPPIAYFTRSVDASPEEPDYLFNLGYGHALAGDASAALRWLRETVRFDATDGDAHLVMSRVLAATGKTVEAQRELELAALLGTETGETTGLGREVPDGLERLPGALDSSTARRIATIERADQLEQREVARFYLEQGRRLFEQQRDREAIDELRRAVYLSPYEDEPHLLLGRLYQRAGQLGDAVDEFKVAIWCRETAEARVALGEALLASGDRAGARREAERALALQPNAAAATALIEKIGQ